MKSTNIINEFEQSGFRGPFNRYRAQDIDFEELQEFKNVSYPLPACFITGTLDPVNFFARDESASQEDILEALSELEAMQESVNPLKPHFDPAEFVSRDPAPQVHAYKLGENVLTYWAEQCT